MLSQEFIKNIVSGLSTSILTHGSWVLPIGILIVTFCMKWVLCRKPTLMNFYRLLLSLPIDIKSTSCTFILAAVIFRPDESFGILVIFSFCVLFLAVSVGFYNYLGVDKLTNWQSTKANVYMVLSLAVSILVLTVSINVMQAYEPSSVESKEESIETNVDEATDMVGERSDV